MAFPVSPLLALSGETLLGLADPPVMIAAMERAAAEIGGARMTVPAREHIEGGKTTLLVMASAFPGLLGTKLVSLTPENAQLGLPVTQGLMMLFDGETGMPLAILDAASLTCQRTGAVAASAIRALSDPGLDMLGIVGCGVQAAWAAIQTAAIRPIRRLACLTRSDASFAKFSRTIARFAPDLAIARCANAADLLARADCVIAATTSVTPVLPDDPTLLAGKLLVSIGSYRPHMQELPDAAYHLAGSVIVDSPHAAAEVGDVMNALERGLVPPGRIIGLGE